MEQRAICSTRIYKKKQKKHRFVIKLTWMDARSSLLHLDLMRDLHSTWLNESKSSRFLSLPKMGSKDTEVYKAKISSYLHQVSAVMIASEPWNYKSLLIKLQNEKSYSWIKCLKVVLGHHQLTCNHLKNVCLNHCHNVTCSNKENSINPQTLWNFCRN